MNPVIKDLLKKEVLTGEELGRFYLTRWIDIQAGVPINEELAGTKITTMEGWKGVYSQEYDAYRLVYVTLYDAQTVYTDKIRLAQAACAGLALFQENVFFANSNYPACHWKKYKLGELDSDQLALRLDLWTRLRNSIAESIALWGAFKVVGAWLEIPGVAATLIDDTPLREQVQRLNNFASHSKAKLKKLGLSSKAVEEVNEVFEPCTAFRRQPQKRVIEAVQRSFKLDKTFGARFLDALDDFNPYSEEALIGRGYDAERI